MSAMAGLLNQFVAICVVTAIIVCPGCDESNASRIEPIAPVRGADLGAPRPDQQPTQPPSPRSLHPTGKPVEHTGPKPRWVNESKPAIGDKFERGQLRELKRKRYKLEAMIDVTLPQARARDGYSPISFSTLAGFKIPQTDEAGQTIEIPDDIKSLNGKKIAITGFMYPLNFDAGKTSEFILMRMVPSCYFCQMPSLTDWIDVATKDHKLVDVIAENPVVIYGTIQVGPVTEDGYVTSVYRISAEDVRIAK